MDKKCVYKILKWSGKKFRVPFFRVRPSDCSNPNRFLTKSKIHSHILLRLKINVIIPKKFGYCILLKLQKGGKINYSAAKNLWFLLSSNEFIILGMFIAWSTNAPKTGSDHRFSERSLSIWNELSKQIWTTAEWHLSSKCAGMALSPTNISNFLDWKPARQVWELSRVPKKTVMPKKSLKYIKGDKRNISSKSKIQMIFKNISIISSSTVFN